MSELDGVLSQSHESAASAEAHAAVPGKQTLVQRAASGPAPSDPSVVQPIAARGVASGGGPVPFRDQMEAGFGVDFSEVRFHSGGGAAAASRAIGADAYTSGSNIAMAVSPTPQLVAHELAHVVQQRAGAGPSSGVGAAGDAFEHEADHAAASVASGGRSDLASRYGGLDAGLAGSVQRLSVQRFESGEHAMIGCGPATSGYPDGEGDLALPSGAVIFMGEMVAFGDFYADMTQLQEAPRQEVDTLAGTLAPVAGDLATFTLMLDAEEGQDDLLVAGLVLALQARGELLGADECYDYKLAPIQGGDFEMDNIEVVDFVAKHIAAADLHRQLAEAAPPPPA